MGESSVYRDGTDRHERMMNHLAFDIAEMSMSSFTMAVARNPNLPVVGVPVFPRRFFSIGQMYVNAKAGIATPKDLIGRKVGLHSFQTNSFGPRQRRPQARIRRALGEDPLDLYAARSCCRSILAMTSKSKSCQRAKTWV